MTVDSQLLDEAGALKRLGGDHELLAELAQLFEEDGPVLLQRLEQGIQAKQPAAVRLAAHSLRGLAANFGAGPLVRDLLALEEEAEAEDRNQSYERLRNVQRQVRELREAIEPLRHIRR